MIRFENLCPMNLNGLRDFTVKRRISCRKSGIFMHGENNRFPAELRKVFDGVKAEAIEKKMAAKKFPKFWLEKRKAAGF